MTTTDDLKIAAVQLALTEGSYEPRWVNGTLAVNDKQKHRVFFTKEELVAWADRAWSYGGDVDAEYLDCLMATFRQPQRVLGVAV